MADTSVYSMGQIRYTTNDEKNEKYMKKIENFKPHLIDIENYGGTMLYQDVVFYNDSLENFSQYKSYYLKLKFPRNLSYDMTFDLKLIELNNDKTIKNLNQYQEIKRFVVAKDSSNKTDYRNVILYPRPKEEVQENQDDVAVSIIRENREKAAIGEVYIFGKYDEKGNFIPEGYKIKKDNEETGKNDIIIQQKNDQPLILSWLQTESKELFEISLIFSNKTSGSIFNAVLLEMFRIPYDDDIAYPIENPEYKGRVVEIDRVQVDCYEMQNLVPKTEEISSFNSIGVWSHPNSIMTINGEEIRIGQSGYYELNDFEITNFGIVVDGAKDKFSLDYQYKISD